MCVSISNIHMNTNLIISYDILGGAINKYGNTECISDATIFYYCISIKNIVASELQQLWQISAVDNGEIGG